MYGADSRHFCAANLGLTSLAWHGRSEQCKLAGCIRRAKTLSVEIAIAMLFRFVADAAAGDAKASFQQRGELAAAAHPGAEAWIVVATAAHRLDAAHHVRRFQRKVMLEP